MVSKTTRQVYPGLHIPTAFKGEQRQYLERLQETLEQALGLRGGPATIGTADGRTTVVMGGQANTIWENKKLSEDIQRRLREVQQASSISVRSITDIDTRLYEEVATRTQALQDEAAARQAQVDALWIDVNANAAAVLQTAEDLQYSVFYQATAPAPGVSGVPDPIPTGARWYDSDDGNHAYYWDGAQWLDLQDGSIGANASSITALDVRLTSAEGDLSANASALQSLDTTVTNLQGTVDAHAQQLTQLEVDLEGIELIGLLDTAVSSSASAIQSLDARVTYSEEEMTTMASDISALQVAVSGIEGGEVTLTAVQDLEVRVTANEGGISSNSTSITVLQGDMTAAQGDLSAHTTAINSLDTRMTSAEGSITAQASDITALEVGLNTKARTFSQATPPTATAVGDLWIETDNNNKLWRWNGTSWVASDNPLVAANATAIGGLDTRVTANEGSITAQASDITALDSRLTTAEGNVGANATAIGGLDTRVTATEGSITAQASDITALQSTVSTKNRTFAQNAAPTAIAIGDLWIETDNNNKLWRWNGTAWADADNLLIGANATAIGGLDTRVTANEGTLTAQASDITALDSRLTTTEGNVGANATAIGGLDTRVTATEGSITAQASDITALESSVSLKSRTFAQAAAPTASAVGDLWIETDNGNKLRRWNGTSWVEITDAAIGANATAIGGLDTRVTSNEGSITTQASQITTLQANVTSLQGDVNTAEVNINANATAITNAEGDITALYAKYGVSLNVNGYVTGFAQHNNGTVGTFTILADKFAIVDPSGDPNEPEFVPFAVSGGTVYMQNVVIGDAVIGDLNVGKLTTGALTAQITQNADWEVGTGRIIFDNGTHLKAQGIGFGSSNQFIEWFGVRPTGGNLSLCTEANAIQYLKTNGDAYFGGALSAGVLKNSAETTSISNTAQVSVGPFGSNGGSKTYNLSYSFSQTWTTGTQQSFSNPTATVRLYRSIGGGAESLQTTLNVNGTFSSIQVEPGLWSNTYSMSGSTTKTDTSTSTSDFELRAALEARSPGNTTGSVQQKITVISTEE